MAPRFISAKYDVSTLTVDYARDDGAHLLRTGGTIAWRFNNPGNIRPPGSKLIMGAIGIGKTKGNGSFLIFASYEEGRAQKKSLLRRKYNDRTIYTMLAGVPDKNGDLVMGYAPATDNNDPQAYADAISKHTGLKTDTVLSTLSDAQLEQVLDAMEKKEGFHGQKATRKEKWLHTTTVTVSDGAAPKPNLPVKVKIGPKTYDKKTDAQGQLPKIAHLNLGEKVEVYVQNLAGEWKKELDFIQGSVSSAYVMFHDLLTFSAPTAPKKAPPAAKPPVKQPIRYIVQPGDTVGKIAARYKTTVAAIQQHNPAIKDVSKIYVGQVIGIYGRSPAVKPRTATAKGKPAVVTRSKEGAGEPLAIVQADQRQAPWMIKALAEASEWAGNKEGVITKTDNYHHEVAANKGNLSNTPWCASFVNYCLKASGTPYESSASSQFPTGSKKFIKIDKPVYGALMVMRNYYKATGKFAGTGHVTFVYGKTKSGAIAGLGGNQGDMIRVSPYASSGVSSNFVMNKKAMQQKFHGFYIPATYAEFAKTEGELDTCDPAEVNKNLLKIKDAETKANESSR